MRAGEIEGEREQHSAEHHRLAPDAVRQPAEEDVERRADEGHDDQQHVLGRGGHAERLFEEHLHVEKGEIPDRTLRAHDREEGDQHLLEAFLAGEGFAQRGFRGRALIAQFCEGRALAQFKSHPQRDGEQEDRHQKRDPPTPGVERLLAKRGAGGDDHQQGRKQPERGRRLDPAGRRAALMVVGMFGDVNCRAAIFAAKRSALTDAQEHQQNRGDDPGGGVGRQQADGEGCAAHQADGGEEGRLAPHPVAHRPEDDRAQWPEREPDREQGQRGDQRGGGFKPGEEHLGDDRGEAAKDEEVIPFERGPRGGSGDDPGHRPGFLW